MALLSILRYPDPRLHTIAKPVTAFDERLAKLVANMADTMYTAPGIGLAATQVDVHEQVIVIDVSDTRDQLLVLVNPEIVSASDERQVYDEGCLSVPGIFDGVERPLRVRIKAQDASGKLQEFDAEGLLAVEQADVLPLLDDGQQFLRQVKGIVHTAVHAHAAQRIVDVGRVAGQQHAAPTELFGHPLVHLVKGAVDGLVGLGLRQQVLQTRLHRLVGEHLLVALLGAGGKQHAPEGGHAQQHAPLFGV